MKPYLFFHIPKTGGLSVQHHLINRSFRIFNIYDLVMNLSTLPKSISQLDNFDYYNYNFIFTDHMNIKFTEILSNNGKNCNYISMVREPIQRFISSFYYAKSYKDNVFREIEILPRVNYCHVAKSMELKNALNNIKLSEAFEPKNIDVIKNFSMPHLGFNVQSEMFAGLTGYGTEECYNNTTIINDSQLYSEAVKYINKFRFIGLLEEYELSLAFIQYLNNSYFDINNNKINTFNSLSTHAFEKITREEISTELLKKITKANQVDISVYNYIKEMFWGKITKNNDFISFLCKNNYNLYMKVLPKCD